MSGRASKRALKKKKEKRVFLHSFSRFLPRFTHPVPLPPYKNAVKPGRYSRHPDKYFRAILFRSSCTGARLPNITKTGPGTIILLQFFLIPVLYTPRLYTIIILTCVLLPSLWSYVRPRLASSTRRGAQMHSYTYKYRACNAHVHYTPRAPLK